MGNWESQAESNEWYTPAYIFEALECEFDLDAAAPVDLSKVCVPAKSWIHADSLSLNWEGFTWLNPPWGERNSKAKWLEKMYDHGNGIVLVPDRSSTDWWQDAAKKSNAMLMVNGKIKFMKPDGTTGDSPSTGTTLFAYGEKAVNALRQAEKNGLGIVLSKVEVYNPLKTQDEK